MRRFLGVTLAALVAGIGAVPAWAASGDDLATLQAEMKAADSNVHSMRMQMTSPMGVNGVTTVDRNPMRAHFEMTGGGPLLIEMYIADGFLYERIGGAAAQWKKHPMPDGLSALDVAKTFADAAHLTLAPDVTEAGVRYGAFDIQMDSAVVPGMPQPPAMKMSCTYDKKTFLVRACKNDFLTEAFRYNDPSDAVVLPAEVADAIDGGAFPFPTVAGAQASAAKPDPATASLPDRAATLVGTWSCESIQHSLATETFARNAVDTITMKNTFRTATGLSGEWDETYRYDAKSGQWRWTSTQAGRPELQETGSGPRWTGDKWTIEGQMILSQPSAEGSVTTQPRPFVTSIRSVYTSLGADAFRHDIERFQNGMWVTGSASTCKRA